MASDDGLGRAIPSAECPTCPACHNKYSVRGSGYGWQKKQIVPSLPLLLQCGHTMCSNCIKVAIRRQGMIACTECEAITQIRRISELPRSVYMLGLILDIPSGMELPWLNFNLKMVPTFTSESHQHVLHEQCSNTVICESCSAIAHLVCCNCDLPYCGPCFQKKHKTGTFADHTSKSLTTYRKKASPLYLCTVAGHEQKALEYFCTDDDKSLCSDCVVSSHKGHDVVKVSDKFKEAMGEFREKRDALKTAVKCIQYSERTIMDLKAKGKIADEKSVEEIRNHFQYLHGMLQLRESVLISEVMTNIETRNAAMKDTLQELEDKEEKVNLLISEIEECLNNGGRKYGDIRSLLNNINGYLNMPCIFTQCDVNKVVSKFSTETVDWQNVGSVAMDLSPDFLTFQRLSESDEALQQALFESDNFSERVPDLALLVPEDSQSSDVMDEPSYLDEGDRRRKLNGRKAWMGGKKLVRQEKQRMRSVADSPLELIPEARNFSTVKVELARVIHIVSPSEFYVQRTSDLAAFDDMTRRLDCVTVANLSETRCVQEGKIYLVKYKQRDWRRTRIKSIMTEHDKLDIPTVYDVFYIDFGTSEMLCDISFYDVPAEYLVCNRFTIRCSLFEIEPFDVLSGWSDEATELVKKYADSKEVKMMVYSGDDRDGEWLVDIGGAKHYSIASNSAPLSVRTNLVFLNLARYSCPIADGDDIEGNVHPTNSPNFLESFLPAHLPDVGETFLAQISFVHNPDDLYVQRMGEYRKLLEELVNDMQLHYQKIKPNLVVRHLVIGMSCVAQYSDGKFYRAKVIGISDERKIHIFYVDFGNFCDVDYVNILRIVPKFMRLPELAIRCSLADILPPDGENDYSLKSRDYISKFVLGKDLTVRVEAKTDEKLFVSINFVDNSFEVNLNSGIVCEKLAKSSGPCSVNKFLDRERKKASISYDAEFIQRKGKPLFQGKGLVTFIESPSSIYVQMHSDLIKITTLADHLKRYYDQSLPPKHVDWTVGTMCVTQSPNRKTPWCRARIDDIVVENAGGSSFKVLLIDYGNVLTVTAEMLREIEEPISQLDAFAHECHLVGIAVPGGTSKWPSITNDFLIGELMKYENIVYISQFEDSEEEEEPKEHIPKEGLPNTMPVDLFVEVVEVKGPFDPKTVKHKSVTDMLLEQGLVLPTKANRKRARNVCVIKNEKSDETKDDCIVSEYVFESYDQGAVGDDSLDAINIDSGSDNEMAYTDNLTDGSATPSIASFYADQLPTNCPRWLPPIIPRELGYRFEAVLSYIDDNAYIHMHDAKQGANLLSNFEASMKVKYEDSESQASDFYWYPGQSCIAQYTNGKWYRGRIVAINFSDNEALTVEFIDYGNTAKVKVGQVRKNICLREYPQQAFACRLFNTEPSEPGGRYSCKELNYIQQQISEKMVWVTIRDPGSEGTPPAVEIELNGIVINDYLVSMGFARCTNEMVTPPVPLISSPVFGVVKGPKYAEDVTMTVGVRKAVKITSTDLVSPTIIYVRVNCNDSNVLISKKNYRKILNTANKMPQIEPRIGIPCCAKYKKMWERAIIEDVDEDQLCTVFYVDKGIQASLRMERLKEVPSQLLEHPPEAFRCELHQLQPNGDVWTETLSEKLRAILDTRKTWFIDIKECGNPIQVDLIEAVGGIAGDLAYKTLIESNDVKLVRKKSRDEMM